MVVGAELLEVVEVEAAACMMNLGKLFLKSRSAGYRKLPLPVESGVGGRWKREVVIAADSEHPFSAVV